MDSNLAYSGSKSLGSQVSNSPPGSSKWLSTKCRSELSSICLDAINSCQSCNVVSTEASSFNKLGKKKKKVRVT